MNSLDDVERHIGSIAIKEGLWSLLLDRRAGLPRDRGWCGMSQLPDPTAFVLETIEGKKYRVTVEPM